MFGFVGAAAVATLAVRATASMNCCPILQLLSYDIVTPVK
jgi:hypothetical protein